MDKSPNSVSSYARAERLSNGQRISAIVEWPCGLSGVAVLYPMGDSFEESEMIRGLLEGLLQTAKEGAAGPGQ